MIPIPAIDIQNGKCVRLQKGDLDSTQVYFEDPSDARSLDRDGSKKNSFSRS